MSLIISDTSSRTPLNNNTLLVQLFTSRRVTSISNIPMYRVEGSVICSLVLEVSDRWRSLYFADICQGIRERPASALPTSRLAPRELFCPDCVTRYCDSPCEEPDPTLCYTGYGSRPYEAYGTSSLCSKPYEKSGSDHLYVGQGSKPYEAPGTAPFCIGNGSKPCEESGPDQSCTGYGSRPYKDSGPAPPSSGYNKKQYGGESGRTIFFTAYSNTPCEEPDPDAMCTIDSYCDGGWTTGLCL